MELLHKLQIICSALQLSLHTSEVFLFIYQNDSPKFGISLIHFRKEIVYKNMGAKSSKSGSDFDGSFIDSKRFSSTETLGIVRLHKRHIAIVANHWAVAIEVINCGFINVQFHESSTIQISYHNTASEAALETWGDQDRNVRTSNYGKAHEGLTVWDLRRFVWELYVGEFAKYFLFTKDCQNFARRLVGWLTGKWVDVIPDEGGPVYSP
jgi:hypothetical protein